MDWRKINFVIICPKQEMETKKRLGITLLMASMLTMLANAIISPTLPSITEVFKDINHAEVLTKLMMTVPSLTVAILAPIAGRIIDAYGRLKVLTISLIIYTLAGTSGFWLDSLSAILVGRFFLGLGVAGIMTAVTTLVGDYFVGEKREWFMSLQGAFVAIGGLLFITSSGFLADINWRLSFLIYAFALLVLVQVPFTLFEPKIEKTPPQNAGGESVKVSKIVGFIFASGFIGTIFFYMVPIQIPYLLRTFEGINNNQTGLAIGFLTVAQAIASYTYKNIKRKFGFVTIYSICFIIIALGYTVIGYGSSYIMVVVGIFISGIGFGWQMPNVNLWLLSLIPGNVRGKFVGTLTTFTFLGMFISPIAIQPIQNLVGLNHGFVVSAVIIAGLAILYFILSRIGVGRPAQA